MKNADKLLSPLNDCSNDKNASARVHLIAEITQSPDYNILQRSAAFQRPFVASYSTDELEKLDDFELEKRKKLLHMLLSFHAQLLLCIHFGNGPALSSDDSPNFTSEKSISRLLQKISVSHERTNYSNIDGNSALALFENSTVKSAQECFDLLPVSLTKHTEISEAEISKSMGNILYCIDISEFDAIHKQFLDSSEKGEHILSAEKLRRRKHRLLKVAVVLMCFGTIFAFAQFGVITEAYTAALYVAAILAAILYFIWG